MFEGREEESTREGKIKHTREKNGIINGTSFRRRRGGCYLGKKVLFFLPVQEGWRKYMHTGWPLEPCLSCSVLYL